MANDDEVLLEKLHEFIELSIKTSGLRENFRNRKKDVENVFISRGSMYERRAEAYAAMISWSGANSRLFEIAKALRVIKYLPVESTRDVAGVAKLCKSFQYNGKCGIRMGQANLTALMDEARRFDIFVRVLPARGGEEDDCISQGQRRSKRLRRDGSESD